MIESMLESIIGYLNKTQDLPISNKLATKVHATAKAQEALSKDVTEIKNILAAPISKATTPSYTQAVKNPYILKPTVQPRPLIGHWEILIKLNETNAEKQNQRATAQEVKERINSTLRDNQDIETRKSQIIVVKQHPSRDLTLFMTN